MPSIRSTILGGRWILRRNEGYGRILVPEGAPCSKCDRMIKDEPQYVVNRLGISHFYFHEECVPSHARDLIVQE